MKGLESITCSSITGSNVAGLIEEDGMAKLVHVSSIHLIGIEDTLKTQSETLAGVSISSFKFVVSVCSR